MDDTDKLKETLEFYRGFIHALVALSHRARERGFDLTDLIFEEIDEVFKDIEIDIKEALQKTFKAEGS